MTRINLTTPEIIEAFFPHARDYSYTVTQDDFDEYDNEAPGDYAGVEVNRDEGRRWDAGLVACEFSGIRNKTREGYTLRLAIMYPDGVPQRATAAIDSYFARLEREEAERRKKIIDTLAGVPGEIIPCKKAPGIYLHVAGSPERQAYIRAVAERALIRHGWLWMGAEHHDTDFVRILRAYWDLVAPGWTQRDGSPSSDEHLIALHAHSGIKHHLESAYVPELTSAIIDIPAIERKLKLTGVAQQLGISGITS